MGSPNFLLTRNREVDSRQDVKQEAAKHLPKILERTEVHTAQYEHSPLTVVENE